MATRRRWEEGGEGGLYRLVKLFFCFAVLLEIYKDQPAICFFHVSMYSPKEVLLEAGRVTERMFRGFVRSCQRLLRILQASFRILVLPLLMQPLFSAACLNSGVQQLLLLLLLPVMATMPFVCVEQELVFWKM